MKIAYLILAHRYPNQLIRLIKTLKTEKTHFYVHLDKKMDEQTVKNLHTDLALKNVFFVRRFTCHWAGFGIMQATYQGFKEIMESGNSYDYISLLSGQDYPIKSNEYIQNFFASHNGTSFIEHIPFPKPDWIRQNGGWDRIKYWHFRGKNYYFVFPYHKRFKQTKFLKKLMKFTSWLNIRRKFPKGLHPYGGAQFWCLHKSHADKVYEFMKKNKSYFNYFKYVYVSDEILFQTILGNLKDKTKLHNDTLHFLEWRRKGANLYTSDFENIENTHYLFARKFDTTVDEYILDLIDKNILQKSLQAKNFL